MGVGGPLAFAGFGGVDPALYIVGGIALLGAVVFLLYEHYSSRRRAVRYMTERGTQIGNLVTGIEPQFGRYLEQFIMDICSWRDGETADGLIGRFEQVKAFGSEHLGRLAEKLKEVQRDAKIKERGGIVVDTFDAAATGMALPPSSGENWVDTCLNFVADAAEAACSQDRDRFDRLMEKVRR